MRLKKLIRAGLRKMLFSERELLAQSSLIHMISKSLKYSNIDVKVIFEIGANHGQDGRKMQKYFNVDPANTYLFEPHPGLAKELKNKFSDYQIFEIALSNHCGEASFNIIKPGSKNDGVSTLGNKILVKGDENFEKVNVEVSTLDHLLSSRLSVKYIDVMKIDVEGFTYEVLQGGKETFRDKVGCIQLESETVEVFEGQYLYEDISKTLSEYGFIEMYKEQFVTQNDTVWIHKRHLLTPENFYERKD